MAIENLTHDLFVVVETEEYSTLPVSGKLREKLTWKQKQT